MVSESPRSKLKVFLGLIWPPPDSINMVGQTGGYFGPYSTFRKSLGGGITE